MNRLTRRNFIRSLGTLGGAAALGPLLWPSPASSAKPTGRILVVGGGFGGATCAKYLRKFDAGLDVTLIERDMQYSTCPFSNTVLGGMHELDWVTHSYEKLRDRHGVKLVHDEVSAIDPAARKVTLGGGKTLHYDRLVLSPGIDFSWGAVEGYDAAASRIIPHAWKAGEQTLLLRKQLHAMRDGGVVIIAPPDNPFRCPPGPYERASLIAHYLKQHKPKSKILILDAKDKFSKQPLFMQGWEKLYPGMIEWVKGSAGGRVYSVDAKSMTLRPEVGKPHKGDVINFIPSQQAGGIAHAAGLVNNDGWCPVNQRTFESKVHKGVHVIGDASIAGVMPKSGFAANSQAKVCAAAIVSSLHGMDMPDPSYVNTCYSLVGPEYGISVAAVYRLQDDRIIKVKGSGGVSPKDADDQFRQSEARYAVGWYQSITSDVFG
jgi:sulfide dehydrogenase [flavocytochrome c] flavoprotein subunit